MITWILVAFLIIFYVIRASRRPKNYPPGPRVSFFIFWNKRSKLGHEVSYELSEKYGPVVGLYFGPQEVMIVNGYEAVKECLTNDLLNGRSKLISFNDPDETNENLGILSTDEDLWKDQRRFTLWHLRDFGFGKGQMEESIHSEVGDLLEFMEQTSTHSEPLVVTDLFGVSIINVLWAMMAGQRYPYGDKKLRKVLKYVEEVFRSGNPTGGFWASFPKLRKMFPNISGYAKNKENKLALQTFIREQVDQHKKTLDESSMRDFMDTYIKEMSNDTDKKTFFTEKQLVGLCMDMFMAGSETTTNFLGFSVLYMVRHPDVQKKVQFELDQVIGRARLPSLKDRINLPYTEATILEIFRMASIAPFTIPHRAMASTKLMGYDVPENTLLLINLWSAHMDPEHWGDPEVFRPERFIKEGKCDKDDWLVPFGMGKRVCAGEALARGTSFLFFTALFQKFNVAVPRGHDLPDPRPLSGFTLAPKPFSIVVTLRD